jgi:crotonobetainyl-CoA hydratase
MTDSPHVRHERRGPVLEVLIDRPKANAIDAPTSRALGDVMAAFRDDPDLRVAILSATGDRFFSAGYDLKAFASAESPDEDFGVGGFAGLLELPDLNKPVIAAVNGMAVGGGFELALAADLIVAADHARFALPEVTAVGQLPDAGLIRLPRRVPRGVAVDLLMTGRWMDAEEAHRWGLVREVVPLSRLMDTAGALAEKIASGPPLLYQALKETLRETEHLPVQEAFDLVHSGTLARVAAAAASSDAAEGARAFAEKRQPVWQER